MFEKDWNALTYEEVVVKDEFLNHSLELELEYLLALDEKRLLVGFQETAGRKPSAIRYPGWESTEIQGHTMGHYLTALAQAWATTKRAEIKSRIEKIVAELEKCQRADGYLFASKEELFDRVEKNEPAWVPWYTMHKLVSGLIAVYRYTGNQTAGAIMERLADWIANRVLHWSEEVRNTVLRVEYGGMNDCLYEVYRITKKESHVLAAHQFDEMPLFRAMAEKRDILNGLHANTTIPKILGGLKRYIVLEQKESFYLEMAENFWDIVVEHHTYITGGNSEWEHFGEANRLDGERTACNCETCNVYNMLKLSSCLFCLTGKKKYADYSERAYINTILSSQNHENGMTTYFQPMATGFFKVYSDPFHKFWCCTGTGMENFTKQWEGICYAGENTICINRFVSADIKWNGRTLAMQADLLREQAVKLSIKQLPEGDSSLCIAIRIPEWTAKQPEIVIPDQILVKEKNGYLMFSGAWKIGTCIEIRFPMKLAVHGLKDNSSVAAFSYGPFVLSADLGKEDLRTVTTGVDVTVPTADIEIQDYILLNQKKENQWKDLLIEAFHKQQGQIQFMLESADGVKLQFAPHFLKNQVRYGIYFYIFEQGSKEFQNYQIEKIRKKELPSKFLGELQ